MTLRRIVAGLLVLAILLNAISVVMVAKVGQPPAVMTPLTTLVMFLFAVLHAGGAYGWRRGAVLLGWPLSLRLAWPLKALA